jgi:hypothetical protein
MAVAALVYAIAMWKSGFLELDLRAFLSAGGSSALMGVVVFVILSMASSFVLKLALLPMLIVVGAFIYLGSLRLLHLLTASDLEFAREIVPSRFQPIVPRIGKLLGVKAQR